MTTQFNTSNYAKLNNDITDIMRAGTFSGVMISIYTDSAGTIVATDGTAQLEHKQVSKVNTTGAYTINATGEVVNASIEIVFIDGSSFKSFDNVDEYWYKVEGIIIHRKRF